MISWSTDHSFSPQVVSGSISVGEAFIVEILLSLSVYRKLVFSSNKKSPLYREILDYLSQSGISEEGVDGFFVGVSAGVGFTIFFFTPFFFGSGFMISASLGLSDSCITGVSEGSVSVVFSAVSNEFLSQSGSSASGPGGGRITGTGSQISES
jgi:hypothetical protein